jgi:hypothetical protein
MACAAPATAGGLGRRRLTHYELLGIAPDEGDSAVIEEAGARRSGDVRAPISPEKEPRAPPRKGDMR